MKRRQRLSLNNNTFTIRKVAGKTQGSKSKEAALVTEIDAIHERVERWYRMARRNMSGFN